MSPDDASLSRLERAVCALVGGAAGGSGAVAVFVDGSNVGGVPLLIGVGALFGYLAVSGQRLSQVKVGNSEATFLGRILRDPTLSDEAKAEVAERLDDLPLSPGTQRAVNQILDARAAADEYCRRVLDAVDLVGDGDTQARATVQSTPTGHLLLGGGEPVQLLTEWSSRPHSAAELKELFEHAARVSPEALGLIVTNQPLAGEARYESGDELWLAVSWRGPADDADLAAALRELLREARGS